MRKNLLHRVEIAKLRVEASNFCNHDYYEPLSFCLSPIEQYSSYKFQLKIMFQLVKPSSSLHTDRMINPKVAKPIALRIDINSARLQVVRARSHVMCRIVCWTKPTFIRVL